MIARGRASKVTGAAPSAVRSTPIFSETGRVETFCRRTVWRLCQPTRVARPNLEQRLVAVALADQVGAALTANDVTS